MDTIETKEFVHCREVFLAVGLVGNRTPRTAVANYDKACSWTMKRLGFIIATADHWYLPILMMSVAN